MKQTVLLTAAAVAVLSIAGGGQAVAAGSAGVPFAVTAPNANGTESTEALITGVTLTDMYQIQAGKIAEAKGQSPGVQAFGKTMVTDHTAMSNQMKHIFAATGTKIPTEPFQRTRQAQGSAPRTPPPPRTSTSSISTSSRPLRRRNSPC